MPAEDELHELAVSRLKHHPRNPRVGDVKAIAQSLKRFGQVKPLIVQRSTGYVVAGNHTLLAAKELGWETVKVLVKDLTDDEARAYLLADNRTSDKAKYDNDQLYKLLEETELLEGTGFDIDEMETLRDAVGKGTVTGDTGDAIREKPEFATVPAGEKPRTTPLRDIVLLMPVEVAKEFGEQIMVLQKLWGTTTVVDTVRQAVARAVPAAPAPEPASPAAPAEVKF